MEKEQREKYDAAQKACKPCHSVRFLKVLFDSSAGKLVGLHPQGPAVWQELSELYPSVPLPYFSGPGFFEFSFFIS